MPASGLLPPEPVFKNSGRRPVSVEFDGEGFCSPGIAFEDYSRMTTQQWNASGERRLPTPSWAFNYAEQRELLARFWEIRANLMADDLVARTNVLL